MLSKYLQSRLNKEVGRCTSFTFVFWDQDPVNYSSYLKLCSFLNSLKVPSCFSPEHDRDSDECDPDSLEPIPKPSHWHVVIDFGSGNNKTINQCFELLDPIREFISIAPFDKLPDYDFHEDPKQEEYFQKCVKVWKNENLVRNMRTLLRYFKHLDNPEKYQYIDEEYHVFCGFELDDRIISQSDSVRIVDEILDYVEQNSIFSFWELVKYCRYNNRLWYSILIKRDVHTFINSCLRSFAFTDTGALDRRIAKYRDDED